ncbi:MAG: 4-(cytidine 5'-diphospho)-2-C-methyl-D-erythritol kinase, partial [bacterium]|nr:4-(cytidine 5'-diphospho)-2-C-methyl-D-erythritol kinase [bacterium]
MRTAGGGRVHWLDSPAKINLFLRVLGKRQDGYHEIDTWMQQISLCDRIWIRTGGRALRVAADRGDVPDGRANLAWRAAAALRRAAGASALL